PMLSKIQLPIWVASASEDRVVCNHAIERVAAALPRSRLIRVEGARHEILFETKTIQRPFWDALPL
ncbi:MAG: alpha/beta hydrolase, partial [Desulfamplus sp.]|nr:alpha/beta hydrolase [Desulfamplus sp.]